MNHRIISKLQRSVWLTSLALSTAGAWAQASAPAKPAVAAPAPASAVVAVAAPAAVATSVPAPARAPAQPAALGCLIEASAIVEVGTSVVGVLDSIAVERGDIVTKGQVLAQLEAGVERAAVTLAKTKVNNQADVLAAISQKSYAAKKAKRTAELTDLQFVSNQARDQADSEASQAVMKLAQTLEQQSMSAQELALARAQLAQRTVLSPLSGVVVDRYVSVGERIENRPILKLAQIDPLRVEVVLPAAQFNAIKAGMTARVLPQLPGASLQSASVAIVDRVIDAASNTFRVRLTLPNRDLSLPSGVRCKVEFGS